MKLNDAFPSKYLKTEDLKGRDATVTLEAVELVQLPNGQGRKLVAQFRGKDKAWIINKTNANTIAKTLGSDNTDSWIGQQITIYPTETEFQGEVVDCIRVRRNKADDWQAPPSKTRQEEPPDEEEDQVPF